MVGLDDESDSKRVEATGGRNSEWDPTHFRPIILLPGRKLRHGS